MPDGTSITVPTIDTERLVLRAFRADDADAMTEFYAHPVSEFYGGPLGTDDAWRRFSMYPGHWFLRGWGPWAIELRETGEYVGLAGPWYPAGWIAPEITWALMPGHHGKGYATEAAAAALAATYELFEWPTAVSVIATANTPSVRVAERLGAVREREVVYRYGEAHIYRHRPPAPKRP
jgi:RimJ/RimL family protein N-acetyltransferase